MADAERPQAQPLRLGGMALANGLLVHGPAHWAAAIRGADGAIRTASGRKPRLRGLAGGVPGLRGLAGMGEAIAVIPLAKWALPELRLPFESRRVLAATGAAALTAGVLRRRGSEASAVLVSLVPSLMALRTGDVAAYHGAEHKTIGAYEEGGPTHPADDHAKEHDRCGSHLMAPLVAAQLAGAALLRQATVKPGHLAQSAVSAASFGAAVEVFAWSERHRDAPLARALRVPGHELQRVLGTREPTEDQLEVGRAALDAILRAEGV